METETDDLRDKIAEVMQNKGFALQREDIKFFDEKA